MGAIDIIRARHSVREFTGRPIEGAALSGLQLAIADARQRSGLDIQLVSDNPEVFNLVARFGLIRGASTSIVFLAAGSKADEAIGYWGQRIVLTAQELGLNTCWAAMIARKKSKAALHGGKKVRIAIAVGYGATQGASRKTKPLAQLCAVEGAAADAPMPAWFATAMEAAQLAPTGVNRQNFRITLRADGRTVHAEATKPGGLGAIDLGIVRRNFEEAANETGADWRWE